MIVPSAATLPIFPPAEPASVNQTFPEPSAVSPSTTSPLSVDGRTTSVSLPELPTFASAGAPERPASANQSLASLATVIAPTERFEGSVAMVFIRADSTPALPASRRRPRPPGGVAPPSAAPARPIAPPPPAALVVRVH